MRTNPKVHLALAALALVGAMTLAAASSAQAGSTPLPRTQERTLVVDLGGEADRLVVDDLDTLEPGQSRSYLTDGGKTVIASRDERGVELDVDGRKIRIGGGPEGLSGTGGSTLELKRIELDGDDETAGSRQETRWVGVEEGKAKQVVIAGGGDSAHELVVRQGPDGGATTFVMGGPLPGCGTAELLERLERNPRFQALDEATRQSVREAIQESAPGPHGVPSPPHGLRIEIHPRDDSAGAQPR